MLKINSKETGIYQIKCNVNGFSYIGSTARAKPSTHQRGFYWRIYQHRYKLTRNKHHSYLLQRDFNRYGEDAFDVKILEVCPSEQCIKREQFYLDANGVGEENGSYNICSIAGSTLGVKLSDATKARISRSNKGKIKGITRSVETRKAISDSRKGVKKSPDAIRKMADSKSKNYIIIDPRGNEFLVRNMRAFCRENDLHQGALCRAAKDSNFKQFKGFMAREVLSFNENEVKRARLEMLRVREELSRNFSIPILRKWIFTSKDGSQVVETSDYFGFCYSNGINPESMKRVVVGRRLSCRGWTCRVEPIYLES